MKCPKCGKEIDNDSKFCEGCGETIVAEIPTAPKKKISKKLIAIIAVVVAAVILVVALASGGGSSSLTVPYENDTGAVLNITFEEFTENFGGTLDEGFVSIGGNATGFDLAPFWSNKVEPMTGYEENSGAAYTLYTAFLTGARISASVQGDKIQSIDVGFDYDDNDLATTFFATTIMLCGKMTLEEASEIGDTVKNGISTNTMVYKDGILYAVTVSTVSYTVMAASEEFVQSLEDSGSCNVLRW